MRRVAGLLGCLVAWCAVAATAATQQPSNPATEQPSNPATRFTYDTNSHAATARGVKEFQAKQYTAAASSLRRANDIAPTPAHAFNLGTAQIAAGRREEGSATLERAMSDPKLRADALYNRGTSALVAGAYDNAIRDLTESLRLRANYLPSKRNLEIALAKKREQQKQSGGNQQSPSGGKQPDKKQPSPAPGEDRKEKGDPTVEALLRAVQQQEQEELRRMHRASPEKLHVGW